MERYGEVAADVPDETIAGLIRRARRQQGLSQAGLAAILANRSGNPSLTRQHVTRWESGKVIPGPYWRLWLSVVLSLPPRQIGYATAATRRLHLQTSTSASTFREV